MMPVPEVTQGRQYTPSFMSRLLRSVTKSCKRSAKLLLARRILAGPFAGLRYLPSSHGSSLMPKILGTYELELAPIVDRFTRMPGATIIDIGAAEGYYAVGFAFRNPTQSVIAFEADPEARRAVASLARINHVGDRVQTRGYCDSEALRECLTASRPALMIVDVEGYEGELLDPAKVPLLREQTILVEIHEAFMPGVCSRLIDAFSTSHDIQVVAALERSTRDIGHRWFRFLASCSRPAARSFLWERPPGMCWLFMAPAAAKAARGERV